MGRIDVERFAPGLAVNAHHVVHRRRPRLVRRLEQIEPFALAPAVAERDLEWRDALLQALGQGVIGRMHRGKQRVAAVAWNLDAVELRALANLGVPRTVGVPALAAIEN